MKKKLTPILALVLVVIAALLGITGNQDAAQPTEPQHSLQATVNETLTDVTGETETLPLDYAEEPLLDPDGSYTTKEDVALYIHTYGCLPGNFMNKNEARDLGWEGGGLDDYAKGHCIGGDYFGNHEGLLPEAEGRSYTECDIDTLGSDSRGAKRIVFSNDGLIYYTDDHYESFELLYGEP